ncbi:hypothetical protein DICVIV_05023 [Dictyocaulus viviparus]|uniref:Uncharacterized protein n=1 Tax=Dictyocaulus viviparus TaxID=29172 RepID=A0A0D8XW27_DICVI|nr:hypothetical protein DICVIV_05023 [Dictyocaulus viviparus]
MDVQLGGEERGKKKFPIAVLFPVLSDEAHVSMSSEHLNFVAIIVQFSLSFEPIRIVYRAPVGPLAPPHRFLYFLLSGVTLMKIINFGRFRCEQQHIISLFSKKQEMLSMLFSAAMTTCTINNVVGPKCANERELLWWIKKCRKQDENHEED